MGSPDSVDLPLLAAFTRGVEPAQPDSHPAIQRGLGMDIDPTTFDVSLDSRSLP
ncbi:MAG TPA: hypothetical protein VK034_16910 [Enhygromyxa sp.]|nr:hypothetical protein [Enhygromyxa sp.]